jgi:hypothetical protein
VGDFKNGTAVVYDKEGFAHQIDNHGVFINNRKYRLLWPFHKGFAIAADCNGFFHINTNGENAYSARYKWVEPFYNGLSLVEDFSGKLGIIDEKGQWVRIIRKEIK